MDIQRDQSGADMHTNSESQPVGPGFAYYRGRPVSEWMEALSRSSARPEASVPIAALEERRRPPWAGGAVALITGGGRGIGRLVAQALADAGMTVGITARSRTELEGTVRLVEAVGGVAVAVTADVTDEVAMAQAVDFVSKELGPIDLLINNAGIVGPIGPAWAVDGDAWWRTLDVNLRGTFVTTGLVLPDMIARGHGRVINISSEAGVRRWPTVSAYSVSKAALAKLSENLAHETERHGVNVFSVDPGLLPIGMGERAFAEAPPEPDEAKVYAWVRREFDEGRGADPDDAVALIVALASGRYDELSGRQLSVHDDLDALRADIDIIRDDDLYLLGLRTLSVKRSA
jgi:NAD(P)-dependent dehydrogenase (short-subunit alcohol dehydrogenase family)